MKLIHLGMPSEEQINTTKEFFVNKLYPIVIKPVSEKHDAFMILFVAKQQIDDRYMFFQLGIKPEREIEQEFLYYSNISINKLSFPDNDNIRIPSHIAKRIEEYNKIVSNIDSTNLYSTDFECVEDESNMYYYIAKGVKVSSVKDKADIINIHLNAECYIKLSLYLRDMIEHNAVNYAAEEIFKSEYFRGIDMINIEQTKLDATKKHTPLNELGESLYTTHYTMNCGPSVYKLNWTVAEEDRNYSDLKIALDTKLYDAIYGKDEYINNYFQDNLYFYIIYAQRYSIDGTVKKLRVLRLLKSKFINKTNFINKKFIFKDKEDVK